MPEINKIGSSVQSGGAPTSGAEQLMDLLKDQHIGKEELPGKLKETLLGLPEPESKALKNRIKKNDKDDPMMELIRGRMNKADIQDIAEMENHFPSVKLGGNNRKNVEKDSTYPSVPLGGGKIHGKEPDIPSIPLGGGKVHGKEPDIQSVPLGGRKKWEIDNVGNQQRINLQDLLPEKPKPKK